MLNNESVSSAYNSHFQNLGSGVIMKNYTCAFMGSVTTDINCNGYERARTVFIIASGHQSYGNTTDAEIGYIRCGYDGNNASYTRISYSRAVVISGISLDSSGNIVISCSSIANLLLIVNK